MASLSGNSRSGGKSNWNYYIVDEWNNIKNQELLVDKDGIVYDDKFKIPVMNVKKGTKLKLETNALVENKNSKFASVKINNKIGYLSIANIQKPTNKSKPNLNSKEYTPDKLKLQGVQHKTVLELITKTKMNFGMVYKDEKYENIIEYAVHCMEIISKHPGQKARSETITLGRTFLLPENELKILSKNFGEVLAALYVMKVETGIKEVSFPSDISQQLYDFSGTTTDGLQILYSVKAGGGSSTSLDNINFIIKTLPPTNKLLTTYKKEIEVIRTIINNKEKQHTTITSIEGFFNNVLSNKQRLIVAELNKVTPKTPVINLSQESLNKWFINMKKEISVTKFIKVMDIIYTNILGDFGAPPRTQNDVLEFMYNLPNATSFKNGYLYYPMGSYIVRYLNETGNYKKVLSSLLNLGNNVNQVEVNCYNGNIQIKYSEFKGSKFRFSYNGMSKKPDNRPLGFKME